MIAAQGGGNDASENLAGLCAACHTEWHTFAMASTWPFYEWLQVPALARCGSPPGMAGDYRSPIQVFQTVLQAA